MNMQPRKLQQFVKLGILLPFSQGPSTGFCLEPHELQLQFSIRFKVRFNIRPCVRRFYKWYLYFRLLYQKRFVHFSSPRSVPGVPPSVPGAPPSVPGAPPTHLIDSLSLSPSTKSCQILSHLFRNAKPFPSLIFPIAPQISLKDAPQEDQHCDLERLSLRPPLHPVLISNHKMY